MLLFHYLSHLYLAFERLCLFYITVSQLFKCKTILMFLTLAGISLITTMRFCQTSHDAKVFGIYLWIFSSSEGKHFLGKLDFPKYSRILRKQFSWLRKIVFRMTDPFINLLSISVRNRELKWPTSDSCKLQIIMVVAYRLFCSVNFGLLMNLNVVFDR